MSSFPGSPKVVIELLSLLCYKNTIAAVPIVPKPPVRVMKMKTLEEIKEIIKQHKGELSEKYKVKEIALFGSCVRGDQDENSDVDILVDFHEPVGLLFVHLADFLEELLGMKVDLVTEEGIKPNRLRYIKEDLMYV